MKNKSNTEPSVRDVLSPTLLDYPNAEIIFINRLPPEWGAYIVQAGGRFQYKNVPNGPIVDQELVEKIELHVNYGESVSVFSTMKKCAQFITCACKVHVPGNTPPEQIPKPIVYTAEPTKCLARVSVELVVKPMVDMFNPTKGVELMLVFTNHS